MAATEMTSTSTGGASSANSDARGWPLSHGRRTAHEGSCPCGKDSAGTSFAGELVHNHPDCAIYQLIDADVQLVRGALAQSMNTTMANLTLYARLTKRHAASLSMRRTFGDIQNLRRRLDEIEAPLRDMINDMPAIALGDRGIPLNNGGNP